LACKENKVKESKMFIHISKKNIEEATIKDSNHCMIADAVKDRIPSAQYIKVDLQSIKFSLPETKERYTYFTPPRAQMNIIRFDQGDKSIEPFKFDLKDPVLVEKTGAHSSKVNRTNRKRPTTRKARVESVKRKARIYKERKFGIRMYKE
jgi:hypothetical protein